MKLSGSKKIKRIIALIIIIIGISLLIFPSFLKSISSMQISNSINHFIGSIRRIEEQEEKSEQYSQESNSIADKLYDEMKKYNEDLRENGQEIVDAFSFQKTSFDLSEYGFEENIIGIIKIPKINVELPIYLGATESNLYKGATHLSETSLPLGEESSNVVIAAHRGLIRNKMFRYLDKLVIGDEISITTFWDTLKYTVSEIRVISPTDSSQILIQKDRDLVTLVTCHPYRINNQRYVVYCEREK